MASRALEALFATIAPCTPSSSPTAQSFHRLRAEHGRLVAAAVAFATVLSSEG